MAKSLSNSKEPGTDEVLNTWKTALAAKPSDPAYSALAQSDSRRSHSVSLLRGALLMFTIATVDGPAALTSGRSSGFGSGVGPRGEAGYIVMLVALALRIMSIPIVGLIIVCILGFELLLALFVGYLIWQCMFKVVEDHQHVGC